MASPRIWFNGSPPATCFALLLDHQGSIGDEQAHVLHQLGAVARAVEQRQRAFAELVEVHDLVPLVGDAAVAFRLLAREIAGARLVADFGDELRLVRAAARGAARCSPSGSPSRALALPPAPSPGREWSPSSVCCARPAAGGRTAPNAARFRRGAGMPPSRWAPTSSTSCRRRRCGTGRAASNECRVFRGRSTGEATRNDVMSCGVTLRLSVRSALHSSVWRKVRLRRKSMYCSMRTMSLAMRWSVSVTSFGYMFVSIVANSASPRYCNPCRPARSTN